MRMKKIALTGLLVTLLSACIAPQGYYSFNAADLPAGIYDGYWAMKPINNVANVVKFRRDGSATLFRYSCDASKNYRTANQGTLGQLIEYAAARAQEKGGVIAGDAVKRFIDTEEYKLETIGPNEVKLHAIVIGGWSSVKIHSVTGSRMIASQTLLGGFGGVKNLSYTKLSNPSAPICAYSY